MQTQVRSLVIAFIEARNNSISVFTCQKPGPTGRAFAFNHFSSSCRGLYFIAHCGQLCSRSCLRVNGLWLAVRSDLVDPEGIVHPWPSSCGSSGSFGSWFMFIFNLSFVDFELVNFLRGSVLSHLSLSTEPQRFPGAISSHQNQRMPAWRLSVPGKLPEGRIL